MDETPPILIGIGSSAGGLEALQAFVGALPDKSPFAFIIAQHLSPNHNSLMRELLSRATDKRVEDAKDGIKPETDCLYICPPNKNITIREGTNRLSDPATKTYNVKPSVDLLFDTLSESQKESCGGIILSGTGGDGARGVRFIKAGGGVTLVQQPDTAKYNGMPNAAIATGHVDQILPPELMGEELVEIFRLKAMHPSLLSEDERSQEAIRNIIRRLSVKTGVDFTRYKSSTILRRIARRMAANKIDAITRYYTMLQEDNRELDALYNDVLINVTSFFREPGSFTALTAHLKRYVDKHVSSQLRVWVPGCSSGEEAYTLAIVISELLQTRAGECKVQIFATDIDRQAIQTARTALYHESALVAVDESIHRKYFQPQGDGNYRPINAIREMCIFSEHDVSRDPPFLRMDLISCRNMLIYFTTELQQEIILSFHYALNTDGLLTLGRSEAVGSLSNASFTCSTPPTRSTQSAMHRGGPTAPATARPSPTRSPLPQKPPAPGRSFMI